MFASEGLWIDGENATETIRAAEKLRLQCVTVCCCVLHCVAVCCSVLLCVAACCSVLQHVVVCCSANDNQYATDTIHAAKKLRL